MIDLTGLRIIVSAPRPLSRRRSWGERLWSWPWRPWVSTHHWIEPAILGPDEILMFGDKLVMGERAYEALKKATKPARTIQIPPYPPFPGL